MLTAVAAGLAAAVLLAVVFFLPTSNGTIRVEINDDSIEAVLTKNGAIIRGADKAGDITVAAGLQTLKIKRGDLEFETDRFVLKKGDTVTLKVELLQGKVQVVQGGKVIGEKTLSGPPALAGGARHKSAPTNYGVLRPLSSLALTTRPAPLPGLRSWTVETVNQRSYFGGYPYGTRCFGLNPDGTLLAVGGVDGTLRIYDVKTGKLARAFVAHGDVYGVAYVAWAPDGKRLATSTMWGAARWWGDGELTAGTGDLTIGTRVWDAGTGRLIHDIEKSGNLAWSPDGKRLAIGSIAIQFWDTATWRVVVETPAAIEPFAHGMMAAIDWSPDGNSVFVGGRNHPEIQCWDANTGKLLAKWKCDSYGVDCLGVSPDGGTVATAAHATGLIKLWDVRTGKERAVERKDWRASDFAWTPDGKHLVTVGSNNHAYEIELCDPTTGKAARSVMHLGSQMALAGDGSSIAVVPDTRAMRVQVVDLASGERRLQIDGNPALGNMHVYPSLHWSPEGRRIACSTSDNLARWWDVASGKQIATTAAPYGNAVIPPFAPDGKTILLGKMSATGTMSGVGLYDTEAARFRAALPQKGLPPLGPGTRGAWSPDGKRLALAILPDTLAICDAAKLTVERTLQGPPHLEGHNYVFAHAWSPDGKTLAAGHGNEVRLWDTESWTMRTFKDVVAQANSLIVATAWSPNGKTIAINDRRQDATRPPPWYFLDPSTGKVLPHLAVVSTEAEAIRWSADGKSVLVDDRLEHQRRVEVATGATTGLLQSPLNSDYARFAPDGRITASVGGNRQSLCFHQTANGQQSSLTPRAGCRGWAPGL